jgi:hypothetical protein
MADKQPHVMDYLGTYTPRNIGSLKEQFDKNGKIVTYYVQADSRPRRDTTPLPTGILFAAVQWGSRRQHEQFWVIRAQYGSVDVLVPTPIPMIRKRHTDGKSIFSCPSFGDESAKNLLDDLIRANPESRGKLEQIRSEYWGTGR